SPTAIYPLSLHDALPIFWDPEWKMNPGKVVMPYHPTENLRLGGDFHPWSPETHFQFPQDEGRIDRAAMRCVGVGKCRRLDGGTRSEEHTSELQSLRHLVC